MMAAFKRLAGAMGRRIGATASLAGLTALAVLWLSATR